MKNFSLELIPLRTYWLWHQTAPSYSYTIAEEEHRTRPKTVIYNIIEYTFEADFLRTTDHCTHNYSTGLKNVHSATYDYLIALYKTIFLFHKKFVNLSTEAFD